MYSIRKCEAKDLPSVVRLSKKWSKDMITIGYESVNHTVETLQNKTDDFFMVIDYQGVIVGYTFGEIKMHPTPVFPQNEKYLEIYEIYIDVEHRANGLGHKLIESLKQDARSKNINHFLFMTLSRWDVVNTITL